MLINNGSVKFKILNNDTEETIIKRLADKFKSTPFWLYIQNKQNLFNGDEGNINVVNILEDLKQRLEEFDSFKSIQSEYSKWIEEKYNENSETRLAQLYILYKIQNEPVNSFTKLILEEFFFDSGATNYDWNFIDNVITDSEKLMNAIEEEVDINSKFVKNITEKGNASEKEKYNIIESSEISIDSMVQSIYIKSSKPILLTHVMNKINVDNTNNILAIYNDFFKYNSKHLDKIKSYSYDYKRNTLFLIYLIGENISEIVITEITPTSFKIDVDTIDKNRFEIDLDYISEILLGIEYEVTQTLNTNLKFKFSLFSSFQKELFLDEIMNNPNFYSVYNNERNTVNKTFSKLRFYAYSFAMNNVTFSISLVEDKTLVSVNKCSSQKSAEIFKEFFTNLFSQYKHHEEKLFKIYKKQFTNIQLVKFKTKNVLLYDTDEVDDNSKPKSNYRVLSETEPSLFVKLYSRKCAKTPRIVEDNEIIDETKHQTMMFPVYNEGGLKPRKYVCDLTGKFIYPGLRENTLANKDVFNYIPCCYETNQASRVGSAWNIYFNEHKRVGEKYEHSLYKTNRILPNENRGFIPTDVTKIFNPYAKRVGVFVGPNSFIDAVARNRYHYDNFTDEEFIRQETNKIRQNLNFKYCLQENSDIPEFAEEWFYNNELYFEPRRFFRAVEEYFQVNIFWFEKSANIVSGYDSENNKLLFTKTSTPKGVLGLPNTPRYGSYVDTKRFKNTVYLFLHMGSPVDSLDYPHCEYISTYRTDLVEKIYFQMLLTEKGDPTYLNIENKVSLQYLDSTGRVIRLKFKDGTEKNVRFFSQPLGVEWKYFTEVHLKSGTSDLRNLTFMRRYTRVFLEYCMIKYALSCMNIDEFFETSFRIDENLKPIEINDQYLLEYYDDKFSDDGYIIVDGEDSIKRLKYNMEKLEKMYGTQKYIDKPYITTYFENIADFDSNVLSERMFKDILSDVDQGFTMFNSVSDIPELKTVLLKHTSIPDLNGRFKVYINREITELIEEFKTNKTFYSRIYIWSNSLGFEKYSIKKNGIICVVYKIGNNTFALFKI